METLTDAITLGRPGFGFGMINVLNGQIELILVMLNRATVFCTTIGQNAQQRHILLLEEGDDPVVEQLGRHQGILPVVQFDKGHFAVGIDTGLLVNPANTLDGAHIVGVLAAQIARMFSFNLTGRLALFFGFFQGLDLGFGQHHRLILSQ